MGYCLVPECNHAQESLPCHFFRLFCHICSPGFVGLLFAESQKFCYHGNLDVKTSPIYSAVPFSGIKQREMSVSLVKRVSYSAMLRTMRLSILKTLYCSCPSYETYHFSSIKHLTCALKDIHSFYFYDSYLLKPTFITRKKAFIRFSSFEL